MIVTKELASLVVLETVLQVKLDTHAGCLDPLIIQALFVDFTKVCPSEIFCRTAQYFVVINKREAGGPFLDELQVGLR